MKYWNCFLILLLLITRSHTYAQVIDEIDESVGIVEWQFPTSEAAQLQTHLLQKELGEKENIKNAIYPNLSEVNEGSSPYEIEKFAQHAINVYKSFVAGRSHFSKPFLINISDYTPYIIKKLINEGVRIFSFSSVIRDFEWEALEDLIKSNPDVLFFVSTAHISGNSIPQEKLNETPSRLAFEKVPNVILVGCLEYYAYHIEAHDQGKTLGSKENPYSIDNQPVKKATQYFMMNCRSSGVFAKRFGGTSAATPYLASLASMTLKYLKSKNLPLTRSNVLGQMKRLFHKTFAIEKDRSLREVSFFSIDTILKNAGEPLITDRIWIHGYSEFPKALTFQ